MNGSGYIKIRNKKLKLFLPEKTMRYQFSIFVFMILVTGSTGLLGSHVVIHLLQQGYQVKAMYRSERKKAYFLQLLAYSSIELHEACLSRLSWYKGDILKLDEVEQAIEGCDTVVHCAALVSFHKSDFGKLFKVNRIGTANMVNFSLDKNVKHFIHVSSTAAVGKDAEKEFVVEANKWNPDEKVSGYSLSKYSAEKEVWRAQEEGLGISIVNPSIMFAPGDWNESSMKIFRTLSEGLRFYTKGSNAFVDARDVAKIIELMIQKGPSGERYLATGTNIDFHSLFDMICHQMHVKSPKHLASPFLTELAWRISGFFSRLYGRRPTITKESARSSQQSVKYSSEKLLQAFPEFKFKPLEITIQESILGRMD